MSGGISDACWQASSCHSRGQQSSVDATSYMADLCGYFGYHGAISNGTKTSIFRQLEHI